MTLHNFTSYLKSHVIALSQLALHKPAWVKHKTEFPEKNKSEIRKFYLA